MIPRPLCGFLFDGVSEARLLLIVGENGLGIHTHPDANIIAALLTFTPCLYSHLALVVFLALEIRHFCLLMSSPEKGPTTKAGWTAIMNLKGLVGRFLTNGTSISHLDCVTLQPGSIDFETIVTL